MMKSCSAGARIENVLGAVAIGMVLAACDGGGSGPPPEPARLEVTGTAQSAVVGTPVSTPPQVRVLSADDEPVAGVSVAFTVTQGGGTVVGGTQVTDASGTARVASWTLGTTAGQNQLSVQAGGLGTTISATGTAGPPASLFLVTPPPALLLSDFVFAPQPVIELRDAHGNRAVAASVAVSAALASGPGALQGTTTVNTSLGRAAFSDLSISGAGQHQLRFTVTDLPVLLSENIEVASTVSGTCPETGGITLDFELGQSVRTTMTTGKAIDCLEFDLAEAVGEQYLVLFENLPRTGTYDAAVFPGVSFGSDFTVTLAVLPALFDAALTGPVPLQLASTGEDRAPDSWDFGAGRIYEAEVVPPAGGAPAARVLRDGGLIAMNSVLVEPAVGDTVVVYLEAIPRLSIPAGDQRAVIRYISADLVFAEDVRLPSLSRESGGFNTPMTPTDMQAIAGEYAAFAKVQADALFEGRHNSETEAGARLGGRVLAVHTLMPADNVWGYTYTTTDYFAFDYWVGTNGSTKGLNQVSQRLADDLFMHEIAHMRHWGLLERAGRATGSQRGNRWLVEGFARFSERLPIAMRLLGTPTPSRTANLVLPTNPAFNGAYFFDDVPTYLSAGASMFGGYSASSFVFDYFADIVAASGADPLPAIRDFLVNGGSEPDLDAAVGRWVPGLTFAQLFTRSRIALYTDDSGVAGLPLATQYQQFQLRASRPPGSQATQFDPRNAWPKVSPGILSNHGVAIPSGAAFGYLIDGTTATGSARIDIDAPGVDNGVISITRVR
jgi:hypothetical protein